MSEANDLFVAYDVLWTSFRAGKNQIFRVNLESGDTSNLTRMAGAAHRYPSWSPDGGQIAFTSDRDGTHNLFVLDLASAKTRQLTFEKAPVVCGMQSWPADGAWIYFGLFAKGEPLLCRIRPDGSEFAELGLGIDPAISPDGQCLIYAKHDGRGHTLHAADSDARHERPLTVEPNAFAGVHATWTPDGERVIFADRVDDGLELFSIAPDGSRRKQLTSLGGAATSPSVSPDGQWITFRWCSEVYWKDAARSEWAYREQIADFRPVWRMRSDGSDARVCELLHFHTTIDGSRVPVRPA